VAGVCIQRSAPTGKVNLDFVTTRLDKPVREIAKPAQLQVENILVNDSECHVPSANTGKVSQRESESPTEPTESKSTLGTDKMPDPTRSS
jgi:hypothetical protein